MALNLFKEVKAKCNHCGDIIISKSDTQWTMCQCEKTKIMGKTFKRMSGDNFTDLSVIDYGPAQNTPKKESPK
jgi:hypothetical protein